MIRPILCGGWLLALAGCAPEPRAYPSIEHAEAIRADAPPPGASRVAAARAMVRAFPQAAAQTGAQNAVLSIGTIVLRDGCLRVDNNVGGDPLAYFGAETGLAIDEAGALTLINRASGAPMAHVGEIVAITGNVERVTHRAALAQAAACGGGPIVWVGSPVSYTRLRYQTPEIEVRGAALGITQSQARALMEAEWEAEDARYEEARIAANAAQALAR